MASYSVAYMLHEEHIKSTTLKFENFARDRHAVLKRSIEASVAAGYSVIGLFAASNVVDRLEFKKYSDYSFKNKKYIKAVEWIPRVINTKKIDFELRARKIFPNFKFTQRNSLNEIVAVESRAEYYPVYFLEPYKGNEKVLGYDIASDPILKKAQEFAIDNNMPGSSGRIRLVHSKVDKWGILMLFPIYRSLNKYNGKELIQWRRNNLTSLISIVIDVEILFETSLSYLQPAGIDIVVEDVSADTADKKLYQRISPIPKTSSKVKTINNSDLRYIDIINLNNRIWLVTLTPAYGYFSTSVKLEVWLVFWSGIIINLVLFIYLLMRYKREKILLEDKELLEFKVLERTSDLEEKNNELETVSYSLAHDLRSPLRSISSFSQILSKEIDDKLNKEQKYIFGRIISASQYMAELIEDILELSRINKINIEKIHLDLTSLVHDLIKRITQEELPEHHVQWKIQPNVSAYGDSILINLLLDNLLRNAYKFSVKQSQPLIEFGMIENKQNTYFISDNGIGFDMKYVDKIFKTFQRLHTREQYEGTGIGLSTVKRIIERHGGRIWVNAEKDEGAKFYFTLNKN
ncbi:MAG: CHASE domain-containing protein [Thiohalomonadales bacterium]